MRNAARSHQKRLQTYHEIFANKKRQDRSIYTPQDWSNYFIVTKRKDVPIFPRDKSSDFKPKMIELDSKICHNSVMSILEFFIDRDEPAHLVYRVICDKEAIGDTSDEVANRMGQLFTTAFSVDGYAAL